MPLGRPPLGDDERSHPVEQDGFEERHVSPEARRSKITSRLPHPSSASQSRRIGHDARPHRPRRLGKEGPAAGWDHCHGYGYGYIRGPLCVSCNTSEGEPTPSKSAP
ncbi:endonuclease domain-containing protein [Streptomyces sp. NBC_01214]|uniref:endonuclease domain-containing protein n=1 Tax=Streptomyces sp. NBC_01214 TaxID=2903777 RepID=UPI002B1D325A|nr:endonuclease domain-containing protein [Streptomyces sp. NBC_01214]